MPLLPAWMRRRSNLYTIPANVIVYQDDNGYAYALDTRKKKIIAGPSTDHASVIQEAINNAPDSGRVVVLGSYNIGSTIYVKKPLTLEIYGYWTAQSPLTSSDPVLQFGDTDQGYHKMYLVLRGTIDANNIAGNALKLVRAVDSVFEGGILKNAVGANLAMNDLNSHVGVFNFTCGYGGTGIHIEDAEFTYLENVSTYVNNNNGFEFINTNGVVCNKCRSNGDAVVDNGTGNWVNTAFLGVGVKKYLILDNCEVWTSSNTYLNRAVGIDFNNIDETISVWIDNFYFRPDGGLPSSLQHIFRIVTYYDGHVTFVRNPVIIGVGGKPIVHYPNNVGIMMINGGRLEDVGSPTGVTSRVKIKVKSGYVTENSGEYITSGDGTTTQFSIPHGLVSTPSRVLVTPCSLDATGTMYVTVDSTNIYVNYSTAPPTGTNNVCLYWWAEV